MYTVSLVSESPDLDIEKTRNPFHFLQTDFWALFKQMHGWNTHRFFFKAINETHSILYSISVLIKRIKFFGDIAYIPLGIEFPSKGTDVFQEINFAYNSFEYKELLENTAIALKEILSKSVYCIRFDPPIEFSTNEQKVQYIKEFLNKKTILRKSLVDIQPPDTVLLALDNTEDKLLEAMKPKWRYNIKLAIKKGVTVKACGAESLPEFYKLFKETAQRDSIAIHSEEYYKSILMLTENDSKQKVTLYIAFHEGKPLAGIITLFTSTEAVYLYGASSNTDRNLMATYLLQWTAITDAKKFGSKIYDFYGIPPTDDSNHPMYGLYRFKTGFGGSIVHRVGSIDYPVKKIKYELYESAEKMRAFYYKKVKKLFVIKHNK